MTCWALQVTMAPLDKLALSHEIRLQQLARWAAAIPFRGYMLGAQTVVVQSQHQGTANNTSLAWFLEPSAFSQNVGELIGRFEFPSN